MSRSALVRENLYDEFSNWLNGIDAEQIRPLGDRVVIYDLPEADQLRLAGEDFRGLAIPDGSRTEKWKHRYGVVMAIGPGDKTREVRHGGEPVMRPDGGVLTRTLDQRLPMDVAVGDVVLYQRWPALEFYIAGSRYTLANEEQGILCVVSPDRHEILTDLAKAEVADGLYDKIPPVLKEE